MTATRLSEHAAQGQNEICHRLTGLSCAEKRFQTDRFQIRPLPNLKPAEWVRMRMAVTRFAEACSNGLDVAGGDLVFVAAKASNSTDS